MNRFLHGMRLGDDDEGGGEGGGDAFNLHLLSLTIMWAGVANLGLIVPLFRQTTVTYYLHTLLMWIVCIFTFVGSYMELMFQTGQLQGTQDIHESFGMITLIVTMIICVLGMGMRWAQQSTIVPAWGVRLGRYIHAGAGIILWIIAQVALLSAWAGYNQTIFIGLLIYQIVFFVFRSLYRFFLPFQIQSPAKDYQVQNAEREGLRVVKSKKDLEIYSGNYTVFSDYVYNLQGVYHTHPGGYEIIWHTREREIDRFMYGMEPLEIREEWVPRFSHTRWAMFLAGPPIAKFERVDPYIGMRQQNPCFVSKMRKLSPASTCYLVQLHGNSGQFKYKGFVDVSQLGQYFTLNMGRKTRLYTSVNCMNASNRALMSEISGDMGELDRNMMEQEISMIQMKEQIRTTAEDSTLPLLIKKYDDGYFTSDFLVPGFKGDLQVSRSKGDGLGLQEKKEGKVYIFAGGTGIYPFIDVIDILFKKGIVAQGHTLKQKILQLNPAVTDPILDRFSFHFVASFNSAEDLHPMTLYQIHRLSELMGENKFTCHLKIKQYNQQKFSQVYKGIKMSNERFEAYIHRQLSSEASKASLSHIYMCGPSKMSANIIEAINNNKIERSKYTII